MSSIQLINYNSFSHLDALKLGTDPVIENSQRFKTKEYLVRIFLFAIVLISLFFSFIAPTHAQDVYNFYFQKNQGVTSSGTTTPGAQPSPKSEASPENTDKKETQAAAAATEKIEKLKRWELGVYKTWAGDTVESVASNDGDMGDDVITSNAFSVQGAYRFNKFFSLDAGVFVSTSPQSQMYTYLSDSKDVNGSLGIRITPIHINLFGYELIEIGINAGVMSMREYVVDDINAYPQEPKEISNKKVFKPYLGPQIAINLTPELGLIVDGKLQPKTDGGGYASVGLRYRF